MLIACEAIKFGNDLGSYAMTNFEVLVDLVDQDTKHFFELVVAIYRIRIIDLLNQTESFCFGRTKNIDGSRRVLFTDVRENQHIHAVKGCRSGVQLIEAKEHLDDLDAIVEVFNHDNKRLTFLSLIKQGSELTLHQLGIG